MSYRHAIAISTQADTEHNSQVIIFFDQIQYILPFSETKSKPETIGHFLFQNQNTLKQSHFVPELHNLGSDTLL